MKHALLMSAVLALLALGCQSEPRPNQDEEPESTLRSLPETMNAIESTVADIESSIDTLQERGPITVTRGDENWEVYAYYQGQDPALVRALYSGGEQLYYFFDRRIVRLHEYANTESGKIQERIFSYNENELVEAKSRNAESRAALEEKAFKTYKSPYGDADFRLDVNQVNGSATSFIYGQ
jgi:hypothetical protein